MISSVRDLTLHRETFSESYQIKPKSDCIYCECKLLALIRSFCNFEEAITDPEQKLSCLLISSVEIMFDFWSRMYNYDQNLVWLNKIRNDVYIYIYIYTYIRGSNNWSVTKTVVPYDLICSRSYTQRNLFWILLNKTEIRLIWNSERTAPVCCSKLICKW